MDCDATVTSLNLFTNESALGASVICAVIGTYREQLTVALEPLLRATVDTDTSRNSSTAAASGLHLVAIACESYVNAAHRLGWANVTVRRGPCPPAAAANASTDAQAAGNASTLEVESGVGTGREREVPLLDAIFGVNSARSSNGSSSSAWEWQMTTSEALGAAIGVSLCLVACTASFCVMSHARQQQQYASASTSSTSGPTAGAKKTKRVKRMGQGRRKKESRDPAVCRSRTVQIADADCVEVEMSEAEDPVLSVSTLRNEQREGT